MCFSSFSMIVNGGIQDNILDNVRVRDEDDKHELTRKIEKFAC